MILKTMIGDVNLPAEDLFENLRAADFRRARIATSTALKLQAAAFAARARKTRRPFTVRDMELIYKLFPTERIPDEHALN